MYDSRTLRRFFLLTTTLLSACGAADVADRGGSVATRQTRQETAITGAPGAFLTARFAAVEGDMHYASSQFLRALAISPGNAEIINEAFLACLMDGRPEAVRLAQQLPDSQAAMLLLGDSAAKSGDWDVAEQRYAALPKQGATQLLQPLLVAWAQQGAGHTDAALATLRPFVEGQRLRAVYALHAALIADLGGRNTEAAQFYRTAQTEFGSLNLELGRIIASWQARQGHRDQAEQTIQATVAQNGEMALALPALRAELGTRPIRRATDGIAESYLAFAAALRLQDASDFSMVLIRLALNLRPDLTAARLLGAEILESTKHPQAALDMLEPVSSDDPLASVVVLRRAALRDQVGQPEEALRLLTQLARDNPDRPEPVALQAEVLRSQHRYTEAIAAYDKAIARIGQPTAANWPLFYQRGVAEERAHDWPRAEADFQQALKLSPDQPYVLNYLGYSWTEQGQNLPLARQMIQRAAEARPNDGSIVDSLGWVALREGDKAGAVKWLEKAVELQPEDPTINGHLGDAYWAVGRKLEAGYQWRRALTLSPDPEDVPKLEAKLREEDQALGVARSVTQPAANEAARKVVQ